MNSLVLSVSLLFASLATAVQLTNIMKVEICESEIANFCSNFDSCPPANLKEYNIIADFKYELAGLDITSFEVKSSKIGSMLAYEVIISNGTKLDTVVLPTCYSNGAQVPSVCGFAFTNRLAIRITQHDQFDGYYFWSHSGTSRSPTPEIINHFPQTCVARPTLNAPVLSYKLVQEADGVVNMTSYPKVSATNSCGNPGETIIIDSSNYYKHTEIKYYILLDSPVPELFHFQFQGPPTCNLCGIEAGCDNLGLPEAPNGVPPVVKPPTVVPNSAVAFGNFSIIALLTVLLALF